MKNFISKSTRDFKSLNNDNDPNLPTLLRRNKERYGVSTGSQLRHGLKALWIIPGIYVVSSLAEKAKSVGDPAFANLLVFAVIGFGLFVFVRFIRDLDRTDPVEIAKRPALQPGVKYRNAEVDGRVEIIDENGYVLR